MNCGQRGFTMIEILAALAIGSMMLIGLNAMIDISLDDSKGQQTALYQSQVTDAAAKLITLNYGTLAVAANTTSTVKYTLADLVNAQLLSPGFASTNPFGQTPCVLIRAAPKTVGGNTFYVLNVLVVTEGTSAQSIPDKDIGVIAANTGQGGGAIYAKTPLLAQGAFGTWKIDGSSSPTLSDFKTASCTPNTVSAGSLTTALFYDGPGQLSTDFLYRDKVNGHPELNTMKTPLFLTGTATEDTQQPSICDDTPSTWGGVTTDADGHVLSCESGYWRRQGSRFWKDPVSDYATLIALPVATNNPGDVRMVFFSSGANPLNKAFTWDGSQWVALAVDQNGRLTTDDIKINREVIKGTVCESNGLDQGVFLKELGSNLLLSCQNNLWQTLAIVEAGSTVTDCQLIRPSKNAVPSETCSTLFPQTSVVHTDANDTWNAIAPIPITMTKRGQISLAAWSQMNRGLVSDPSVVGQASLVAVILDSNNTIIGQSAAQSTRLKNDSAGINVNLVKSVDAGNYTVQINTGYSLFDGGQGAFDQANYTTFGGQTVEVTPLKTGWTIDSLY